MGVFLLVISLAGMFTAGAFLQKGKPRDTRAAAIVVFFISILLIGVALHLVSPAAASSPGGAEQPVVEAKAPPPAPAPAACPDPGAYLERVEAVLEELVEAMFVLGVVDRAANPEVYALQHTEALQDAAQSLKEAAVEANLISAVPAEAAEGHALFVQAMQQYYNGMLNFELGLTALAAEKQVAAGAFFTLSADCLAEGAAQLEQAFALWDPFLR